MRTRTIARPNTGDRGRLPARARARASGCARSLLALLACAVPLRAQAQRTSLPEQLRALISKADLGDRVSLSVVDLATGQSLLAHNARLPLNPASNLKLLTAASSMLELGPDFRMRTGLYARVRDGAADSVCVKGQGDPSLTRADLIQFAQRLAAEGARTVDRVIVDGSYFDAATLPPAFEQQPKEIAPFRSAIAALSVDANAYTLRVRPGASAGAPAIVSLDGAEYFQLDNQLLTGAAGAPSVVADERDAGEHSVLSLRGVLPLGAASLAYLRRVNSPLHYAGWVFIDALEALRIKVPHSFVVGLCPSDAPLLVLRNSPPVGQLVSRLGKESDNFVAEMLLKTLGAERRKKPGTSADGLSVMLESLKRIGLPLQGVELVNGSGLFQGNRVTSELLSQLLVAMYANPSLREDFVAHLAVGGVDGTLARRFRNLPLPRIVRAKTGTLDDVIALSGYVLGPRPERAVAFSFLANGVSGKHAQAKDLIDRAVEAIASELFATMAR
jgi:serine-type D-Ala-D-Ala carboxypeptidase/endopeptidase (penicillin-binding protein 4)